MKFEIISIIGLSFLWETKGTKTCLALCVQVQKAVKKSARREQLQREEMEQRRLKTVLELQFLLDQLGDDSVRQELKRPDATGSPLLSDTDLTSLDEFYKLVGPDRNYDVRYERTCDFHCTMHFYFFSDGIWSHNHCIKIVHLPCCVIYRLTDQYEEASLHLWELLEGRDKAVAGTTCRFCSTLIQWINYSCIVKPSLSFLTCHAVFVPDKSLKDTLDKVLLSGYFDRAQTHQNGTCQEEEDQEEQPVVAESKAGKQSSEPGNHQHIHRFP